jgi:hypothetical protein
MTHSLPTDLINPCTDLSFCSKKESQKYQYHLLKRSAQDASLKPILQHWLEVARIRTGKNMGPKG